MIDTVLEIFHDYTFQVVALGSVMLGVISGVLGSFAVLRKQSLLGDCVSHSALPGVVLAFLTTGEKNGGILLLGALISGFLSAGIVTLIGRHSKVKADAAQAIVLSVFFGLGMALLTFSQNLPNANQAGLKRFIYGQASTMRRGDVLLMLIVGGILIGTVVLLWKEFLLFTFDSAYGETIGFSSAKINAILTFLIVCAILIGLQTVGVILMSAMLITPAVAARQWTNRLPKMVALAAVFGAAAGVGGTLISSIVPEMPTGPVIVVCISAIAVFSIFFAPRRGILARLIERARFRSQLREASGGGR
mgnify:FL=1